MVLVLVMTSCVHQMDATNPQQMPTELRVSLMQPWTARGKLLATTRDMNRSLRFTWEHNLGADDIITLGDTLGIRQLVLHEREGMLFERMSNKSLKPIQAHNLEGELSALALFSFEDLASVLIGEASSSEAVTTEVTAWQSVNGIDAPRVIRLRSADIAIKIVINRWELL